MKHAPRPMLAATAMLCIATALASFLVVASWLAPSREAPRGWSTPSSPQCVVILRGGHQPEQSCVTQG